MRILLVLCALGLATPAAAKNLHGVSVRGKEVEENVVKTGMGFRRAVDYYRKYLKKRKIAHEEVSPYRENGVLVARFLSQDATTPWMAIHVFKKAGRTYIAVIPAKS